MDRLTREQLEATATCKSKLCGYCSQFAAKEALLLINDIETQKKEIEKLKEILNKASQILQYKKFENQSKSIDCMAEFVDLF